MTTAIPTIAVFPEEGLTLDQKIEKWVWQLCRTLEENYLLRYPNSDHCPMFRMEFGRKYIKVIQQDLRDGNYRDGGVHAFIDKKTVEVKSLKDYPRDGLSLVLLPVLYLEAFVKEILKVTVK